MHFLDFVQVIQNAVIKPDLFGAISLFFLSIINEIVPFLPFATIISGQLIFLHEILNISMLVKLLFLVAIPFGLGSSLGTFLIYGLGYFGGKPAIEKLGRYLWISWEDIEKIKSRFKGSWYDEILFLLLRSVPFAPTFPVSAAAGILQMPPVSYFVLTSIGFAVRIMIMLMFIGWGVEIVL